jgi:hypothetical protein
VGHHIIFVDRSGKVVRDLSYEFANDGFNSKDLTVLAPHLFEQHGVRSLAYQQSPNSTVWVVRNDGALLSLAYVPEQDVWAWSVHDFFGTDAMHTEENDYLHAAQTLGFALDVAVLPTIDGDDDVYVTTARMKYNNTGTGDENGYLGLGVERISDAPVTDTHTNGVWLDCALTYDGAPTTTPLTGSTIADDWFHVPTAYNESVACVADGAILTKTASFPAAGEFQYTYNPATSAYTLVLGTAASKVVFGIPYTSSVTTMPMAILGQSNAQGRRSRPVDVTVKVKNTRGLNVGYDEDSLVTVNWNDVNETETSITPKTRDQKVRLLPSRSLTPRLYFESDEPSPFNLLSFTAEVEPGD